MQFDRFITKILNESNNAPLTDIVPVFDGRDEIYSTRLEVYFDEDTGKRSFTFYRVERIDRIYGEFDVVYKSNSFTDALKSLVAILTENRIKGTNFLNQVSRFQNLIGEFKVCHFDDGDQPPTYSFICTVDTEQMRKLDIQNNLKNTDTSGLEDLL
jgi:hypothetical protein